ncbi:MAG TPA: HAMP domain-containing sensor histidine kinase [Lacipirellulaceae bacterium]|nr:HAMP domain-containing sensor histidine kinase [Lacipirellulaceae bacterium]
MAELTALGLERALLASDETTRRRELAIALARDPAVTEWVMQTAQLNFGRPIETFEEAINWLAGCLVTQLAAALAPQNENRSSGASEIETRLPALASRLADYEQRLMDFNSRIEHEKLEAMKELAYGASHEINNPLANIAVRAQTLLQDEAGPERARKLVAIHRQAMRAHEMIADLMLFARPPKLNLDACDVRQVVRQVVDELTEIAAEQDTEVSVELTPCLMELEADVTQLAVAVHALVRNALEATGEGGHVRVSVRQTEIGNEPFAEISVRDNGPGISAKIRERMFDPFFSGREAGRGLGFGLSKCWRIVTDHGGRIVVEQPAGGGAEITIFLKLEAAMGSSVADVVGHMT